MTDPWGRPKGSKSKGTVVELKVLNGGKIGCEGYYGGKDGPKGPLTPKMEAFIAAMLKGTTASDAYRQSYNAENMRPNTIRTEASKLVGHPAISKALKEGFVLKRERAIHSGGSLREFIVDRLHHEATTAGTDAARIAALTALGKVDFVGLFRDRVSNEDDTRTAEELKQELETRLKTLFGSAS